MGWRTFDIDNWRSFDIFRQSKQEAYDMQLLKLFLPITKVDEQKREVWGRAVQEVPDKAGEIFDYESSRPHFEKWSSDFEKTTDGKSLGNVRSMHNKVAAGKVVEIDFNDDEKAIDVCAKVVDDNEWQKCLEGVYTGFSIGGSYVKRWKDDGLYRYTAKPSELSLVDSPCIPTSNFKCVKMDGSVIEKAFKTKAEDDAASLKITDISIILDENLAKAEPKPILIKWTCGVIDGHEHDTKEHAEDCIKEHLAKLEQAKKDDVLPTEETKEAATGGETDSPEKVKKGLYSVSTLGSILNQLKELQQGLEYEAQYEGDNSPIPDRIKTNLKALVEDFKALAIEEADELVAEKDDGGTALAMSEKTEGLEKRGARNSGVDLKRLQGMHDLALELGATCPCTEKSDTANDLQKVESLQNELSKVTSDRDDLQKLSDSLQKRVKELEEMPAPAKGVAKVIAKEHDIAGKLAKSDDSTKNGESDEINKAELKPVDLIKSVHREGGTDAFVFFNK
jgi:hypothetical protein